MVMKNNCSKCINFKDAQCKELASGLITMIRVYNPNNGQALNTEVEISYKNLIKTDFADKLCCSKFKNKDSIEIRLQLEEDK